MELIQKILKLDINRVVCETEDTIDLPIPRLYELLEFEYNDEYYFPRVSTKAELVE
jgi:hypothetical protein